METKNIMIVGVGGQGSLLASKLLGHLLCAEGYDVKVSEVHGMSQRGGSVVTYVRYGDPAAKVDLEALCHAVGISRVTVVDPYDLEACDKAITKELAAEGPGVIISRRPCVLLKTVKPKAPLTVS